MSQADSSLQHVIHTMTGVYGRDRRSDVKLLSRYAETGDERALAVLMVRHGSMIQSVCSRVLGDAAEVEVACQIVLMALAQEAGKIRAKTAAGWLHEAASRTAQHILQASKKRSTQRESTPDADVSDEVLLKDACDSLHEELANLPEELQAVLVLHYFEGKTPKEIGRILGVQTSAACGRIDRAKTVLQAQLWKREQFWSPDAITSLLEASLSHGVLPATVVSKAVQTAAAFRDGKLTGGLAQMAKKVLQQRPSSATPWWSKGWLITLLCIVGLATVGVVRQTGVVGVQAGGRLHADTKPIADTSALLIDKQKPSARPDAYGDPLPEGALARLGTLRFRYDLCNGVLAHMTLAADKKLFIPGGRSMDQLQRFLCYDLTNGKVVNPQFQDARGRPVQLTESADLSPDGRLLTEQVAPGGDYGFWDLKTGKMLGLTLKSRPQQMTLSRDGKVVAYTKPFDGGCDLCVVDAGAGKELWGLSEKNRPPLELCYSSDGKTLMAACEPVAKKGPAPKHLLIRRWEASTGKELSSWTPDREGVFVWSYDGAVLAASPNFRGNTIGVWDMTTGKRLRLIQLGDKVELDSMVLSPDGHTLAANTLLRAPDGAHLSLCLWDALTGKLLRRWGSPLCASGRLIFSQDGKWLISVPGDSNRDHSIYIWEVDSGKIVNKIWHERGHKDAIASLAFSSKGDTLTSIGRCGGLVFWNADGKREDYSMRRSQPCYDEWTLNHWGFEIGAVAPNGKTAAYFDSRQVQVWDAATGRETEKFSGPSHGLSGQLTFSPDNKFLAMNNASFAGVCGVLLHNFVTKKNEIGLSGPNFAFSPNGKWLVIGPIGDDLYLWDPATGGTLAKVAVGPVFDLAFSPDCRSLVMSTRVERTHDIICEWRIFTKGSRVRLEGPRTLAVAPLGSEYSLLTFSPDGRTLTARRKQPRQDQQRGADVVIRLWETATGKERRCFNENGSIATVLAFDPDGRRLASGHQDSTILVWDATGRLKAGELRPTNVTEQGLASLWADLAGNDAQLAGRAVWRLAASGAPAASFLKARLHPAQKKNVAMDAIAKLIAGLDDKAFAVRRKANLALKKLGKAAEPSLRAALEKKPSVELRRSVEELLKLVEQERVAVVSSPEDMRSLRALEVLGQIDADKARQVLAALASGDPDARLTQEAQSALNYWKQSHRRVGGGR